MDTNLLFAQTRLKPIKTFPSFVKDEKVVTIFYRQRKYELYTNWYLQIHDLKDRSMRAVQGKDNILNRLKPILKEKDYVKFEAYALLES
jgi:hypothetical protein